MVEWKKMVMIKGNAPRGQQSNSPTTTHWITKTPRRGSKLLAQGNTLGQQALTQGNALDNENAPRGQQALSPGQHPGYEWQRFIRPERAKAVVGDLLLPLWGVVGVCYYTQGGALGYEVFGLSGRNK